jgi:hypothetical protein
VQTPPRGVEAEGTGTSRFRTGGLTCGGSARRDRWPLEPRAQEARTVRGHPAGCAPAMAVHPRRWPDRRDGVRPGAAAHSSHKQSFVRPLLAKSQGTFVGFCTVTTGRPEFSPIGYMEACRSFRQKTTEFRSLQMRWPSIAPTITQHRQLGHNKKGLSVTALCLHLIK